MRTVSINGLYESFCNGDSTVPVDSDVFACAYAEDGRSRNALITMAKEGVVPTEGHRLRARVLELGFGDDARFAIVYDPARVTVTR